MQDPPRVTLEHVRQQLACLDSTELLRTYINFLYCITLFTIEFKYDLNSLMNPLMPSDSISIYTSSLLYVSTSAGARAALDLAWASFITRVAILWIRLTAQMGLSNSGRRLNNSSYVGLIPS